MESKEITHKQKETIKKLEKNEAFKMNQSLQAKFQIQYVRFKEAGQEISELKQTTKKQGNQLIRQEQKNAEQGRLMTNLKTSMSKKDDLLHEWKGKAETSEKASPGRENKVFRDVRKLLQQSQQ